MAFQERMSGTAYQRAMDDMRKAGLNPMLAFDKGGASTPSGAMASLTAPRKGDIGAGLFNTAKTIATEGASMKQMESQTNLNKANQQVADVSAEKITANAKESEANTHYTEQLRKKAEADTRRAKADARMRELDEKVSESRKGIDAKLAPVDAILERIQQVLGLPGSAFRGMQRKEKRQTEHERLESAGSRGIRVP